MFLCPHLLQLLEFGCIVGFLKREEGSKGETDRGRKLLHSGPNDKWQMTVACDVPCEDAITSDETLSLSYLTPGQKEHLPNSYSICLWVPTQNLLRIPCL